MTDEVRKMVDGLTEYEKEEGYSKTGYPEIATFLLKSDVIELVEKLTKWNKVEDCEPHYGQNIRFKDKSGYIGAGYKTMTELYYCVFSRIHFEKESITEWKPIN